jgi:imidazolonepropionase-like amidohydrolase
MRRSALLLALAVLWVAPSSLAQDGPVVYVRAGQLLDVISGQMLADQALVIVNDRIERVGPASEVAAPEGARVIDLSDETVLPGLIDAHVHLTGDYRMHGYSAVGISVPREALTGAYFARITLEAGFTTVRNVGARAFTDVALRDAIAAGELPGPRILASGPALGITGGHCDVNLFPYEMDVTAGGVADGPWAVRRQVRENIKYGADLIKFCATGGVLSKGTLIATRQYTLEEMEALVDEAHALGRKVAAHAHGTAGIKAAIRAGVDSVEHASLLDEEAIALAKEHGTTLVMDVYVTDFILAMGAEVGMLPESLDKERQVGQQQRVSFRAAHDEGVEIAFGTDAAVYPHGDNGKQFAIMVEHGMTPIEAIRAATVVGAELLGMPEEIGALAPGRYADLIAVPGDPLEQIDLLEEIPFVMKGGQIFKDETGR